VQCLFLPLESADADPADHLSDKNSEVIRRFGIFSFNTHHVTSSAVALRKFG